MKKHLKYMSVIISATIILLVYIFLYNASYLQWSEYKVPSYPVLGDGDNETVFLIDANTILSSIHSEKENIFKPALPGNEDNNLASSSGFPSLNQTEYEEIANAVSKYFWKESLNNWHLYFAKFLVTKVDGSFRIYYANFTYFERENSAYAIHDISIDLSQGKVAVIENLYHDTGNWKALDFDGLNVNDVSRVVKISEANGGESACSSVNTCDIGIWLSPSLYEYGRLLSLPLYRYEWGWKIHYTDENNVSIFDAYIDPGNGNIRINK